VETSVRSGRVKIQRLISDAHCSPEEFWYDQVEREFVSPLQRSTGLYDPQTKDLMGEDRSFDMVKCFLTNAAEGRLLTTAMEKKDQAVQDLLVKTLIGSSEHTPATCICGAGCMTACPVDPRKKALKKSKA